MSLSERLIARLIAIVARLKEIVLRLMSIVVRLMLNLMLMSIVKLSWFGFVGTKMMRREKIKRLW